MVQRSQPFPPNSAPSVAWLLCAACGPLSEDMAELAGVRLRGEDGLRYSQRCYEVTEDVPFPTLSRWVAANPQVQEAIARVEDERSCEAATRRPKTHEEMAGSARAALLLGRRKAFLGHYRRYVKRYGGEWHPDPEHTLFWERMLGVGWNGSEAVPEGEARNEIVALCSTAFAFFSPPSGKALGDGICGAPAGEEWLEVAAALREGNAGALKGLSAEGSALAHAAINLMSGRVGEAQKEFEQLLGRVDENRYRLALRHGLPLLVYALVGGVYAGGSLRFLQVWFSYARYMAQRDFPRFMAQEQEEMMLFLDHLELVNELVNRNGYVLLELRSGGALSRLPFALFYSALPAYAKQEVEAEALLDAVEEIAQRGLRLLARYGAAGLRGAASLSPEGRQRLEALLEGEERTPLPLLAPPLAERALAALVECAQKSTGHGSSLEECTGLPAPVLVASRMETGVLIGLEEGPPLESCRPSAALRCMKKFARQGFLVLEGMDSLEFTRLCVALQPQVAIIGSLARLSEPVVEAKPQPVLLLAQAGRERFYAALRLRLVPGSTPLMVPGCGLDEPVVECSDGTPVAVCRHSEQEWLVVEGVVRSLQQKGFAQAGELMHGTTELRGFPALVSLLQTCLLLGLETCWEKEYALRLHQPRGGLALRVGEEAGEWLELGGGLPVDEGRVLELSSLLEAFASREGNALCLGKSEYVLLNPTLERQLALLELVMQEKRGCRGVATAAIPLLNALDEPAASAAALPATVALPSGLQATLRPYQEEGYRWLAERAKMGLGALLADDMGLGKTVQVLALLLHAAGQKGSGASLVVAPISLLGNWAEEAARFAPSLRVLTYDPKKPGCLEGAGTGTLVLASYGQIASRQKDFSTLSWNMLVLDEAQAIKNPDSQRARAVCTLRACARFCLTGTPIENSLLDLWSQMRFLMPGLLGNRTAFQRRFKRAGEAERRLLRQVLAPLVLRRTKGEVLAQLPPLTETIEWVEFSREERALYESLRRAAVAKLGRGKTAVDAVAGVGILAELTRLRRACCHGKLALEDYAGSSAKLTAMGERVEELRAAGRRVLIFSQFTDVLDLAQETLLAQGISCLRLDGSTPSLQRNKAVRCFQEGRADAFLISLKAGGTGLNLTAADYVMLLDPWWNPAVEAQAAGRSHRMGQQQPVTLCRFMVRGTVEERILKMHREKQDLAESILSGSAEGMSLANLRALLG